MLIGRKAETLSVCSCCCQPNFSIILDRAISHRLDTPTRLESLPISMPTTSIEDHSLVNPDCQIKEARQQSRLLPYQHHHPRVLVIRSATLLASRSSLVTTRQSPSLTNSSTASNFSRRPIEETRSRKIFSTPTAFSSLSCASSPALPLRSWRNRLSSPSPVSLNSVECGIQWLNDQWQLM